VLGFLLRTGRASRAKFQSEDAKSGFETGDSGRIRRAKRQAEVLSGCPQQRPPDGSQRAGAPPHRKGGRTGAGGGGGLVAALLVRIRPLRAKLLLGHQGWQIAGRNGPQNIQRSQTQGL